MRGDSYVQYINGDACISVRQGILIKELLTKLLHVAEKEREREGFAFSFRKPR